MADFNIDKSVNVEGLGDLSQLSTTDKTNMVGAVNSLKTETTQRTPWKITETYTGAAVQALINSAVSGDTILLKPGRYIVSSQISWTGKELHIVALGKVVFVEEAPLNAPIIQLTSAHNSTIRGISCEGAETLAGFAGTSAKHYAFIKVISSNNVKIYDPVILNKTYGIYFDSCNYCRVYNPDVTGFLVTGSLGENGANYSSCVNITGGKKNAVYNLTAKDMGSGVLIGSTGAYHEIHNATLTNMRDNGIYISSGVNCKVISVTVESCLSSGVKTRGSKHVIKDCYVKDSPVGFALTGNGTTPDALGYNGYGTKCIGNTAENCTQMGVSIGIQDGYYPRDFDVLFNTLINCGEAGLLYAPIKLSQGRGHNIKDNIIDGTPSDFAIFVTAASSAKGIKYNISNNTIRGDGTKPVSGVRLTYADSSVIANNIFDNTGYNGIDCRFVTNSRIDGNEYPESLVLSMSTSYQSSGNIVTNNLGSNIGPDHTQNIAYGNKPESKNYLTSISAAPYAIGQKALVAGVIYEAVATAAPTDWKQISN